MKSLFVLLLVISAQLFAQENYDICISANCDLYRSEKAQMMKKLKAVGCASMTDKNTGCAQIELIKIVTNFEHKINSIFNSPNAKSNFSSDINFNSHLNLFTEKFHAAPGFYELVPVLSNPNLGVHWGAVVNNQADVEKIINIDPASADVKTNNWYLTQWKKQTPLMLGPNRRDPIITNSQYVDAYLGTPKFEINSPNGKYATETSLFIYKHPIDNSNVFEIVGRNGWLNNVGGSNVFLSSNLSNNEHTSFTNDISLTLNRKISRMNIKYFNNSSDVREGVVIGMGFAAFTAFNSATKTNIFIQINFADTRNNNSAYRGCYMHGDNAEIVYTYNSDNDFQGTAASKDSPLTPKKYDLNKYLCEALSQNYKCPTNVNAPNFPSLRNNLKDWSITSFYTGVETQAAKALANDQSVAGPIQGEVEMGFQYSNMRVVADTNSKYISCNDVANKAPSKTPIPSVNASDDACSKGTFAGSDGKLIEYYCGCGVISGGNKQDNGCFHKVAGTAPIIPGIPKPVSTGACNTGSFNGANGKKIQFSCGCGVVKGGSLQSDGCYHKESEQPVSIVINSATTIDEKSSGTFCSDSHIVKWVCNGGAIEGYSNVGDGCYHLATKEQCSI